MERRLPRTARAAINRLGYAARRARSASVVDVAIIATFLPGHARCGPDAREDLKTDLDYKADHQYAKRRDSSTQVLACDDHSHSENTPAVDDYAAHHHPGTDDSAAHHHCDNSLLSAECLTPAVNTSQWNVNATIFTPALLQTELLLQALGQEQTTDDHYNSVNIPDPDHVDFKQHTFETSADRLTLSLDACVAYEHGDRKANARNEDGSEHIAEADGDHSEAHHHDLKIDGAPAARSHNLEACGDNSEAHYHDIKIDGDCADHHRDPKTEGDNHEAHYHDFKIDGDPEAHSHDSEHHGDDPAAHHDFEADSDNSEAHYNDFKIDGAPAAHHHDFKTVGDNSHAHYDDFKIDGDDIGSEGQHEDTTGDNYAAHHLSSPFLNGTWWSEGPDMEVIGRVEDNTLHWDSAFMHRPTVIQMDAGGKLEMEVNGSSYMAEIMPGPPTRLIWNDGDTWVRVTSTT
jgi:hypothetical protein